MARTPATRARRTAQGTADGAQRNPDDARRAREPIFRDASAGPVLSDFVPDPAPRRPAWEVNPRAAEIVNEMDEDELGCRAEQHDWPGKKLARALRGGKLPRGMYAVRQRVGGFELVERCLNNCGRERITTTRPDGAYDMNAIRRYRTRRGKKHTVIPRDLHVTPTDLRAEVYRRYNKVIAANAQAAPEEDEDE